MTGAARARRARLVKPLTCTNVNVCVAWVDDACYPEVPKGSREYVFQSRRDSCLSPSRRRAHRGHRNAHHQGRRSPLPRAQGRPGRSDRASPRRQRRPRRRSRCRGSRRAGPRLRGPACPHTEEPTNWSRRYKANLEKLASGDVIKVAEVVRDLWRREKDRGLSAGEKRMLAKARQILVSSSPWRRTPTRTRPRPFWMRFSLPRPAVSAQQPPPIHAGSGHLGAVGHLP